MPTQLTRRSNHDPFATLLRRVFDEPWTGIAEISPAIEEGSLLVDVSEDENNVFVRASLPGFKKDEIDVQVHDGVISISGTHNEEHEEKTEKFYRKERRYGSVSRRLALPCATQEAEARAELNDGVLTVRVPKAENATPRKIAIN